MNAVFTSEWLAVTHEESRRVEGRAIGRHLAVDQDLTVADGTGYFFNAVVQLETTPIVGVAPSGIEVIRNR
jgi:hypothetical protein